MEKYFLEAFVDLTKKNMGGTTGRKLENGKKNTQKAMQRG